ncbi:MAG: hypothetical protein QNJ51_18185 [Calothrix sp. MO_167.B12]|nr:hypothetical protein [Calothrix sp. MO_167.B12]
MDTIGMSIQGIFLLVIIGIILYILYFYLRLRQQKRHLLQQLQEKQQLTEKTFAEIHNNPMQTLAFLIREIEIHEVPQQELLEYLRDVYHSILVVIENLNDNQNE